MTRSKRQEYCAAAAKKAEKVRSELQVAKAKVKRLQKRNGEMENGMKRLNSENQRLRSTTSATETPTTGEVASLKKELQEVRGEMSSISSKIDVISMLARGGSLSHLGSAEVLQTILNGSAPFVPSPLNAQRMDAWAAEVVQPSSADAIKASEVGDEVSSETHTEKAASEANVVVNSVSVDVKQKHHDKPTMVNPKGTTGDRRDPNAGVGTDNPTQQSADREGKVDGRNGPGQAFSTAAPVRRPKKDDDARTGNIVKVQLPVRDGFVAIRGIEEGVMFRPTWYFAKVKKGEAVIVRRNKQGLVAGIPNTNVDKLTVHQIIVIPALPPVNKRWEIPSAAGNEAGSYPTKTEVGQQKPKGGNVTTKVSVDGELTSSQPAGSTPPRVVELVKGDTMKDDVASPQGATLGAGNQEPSATVGDDDKKRSSGGGSGDAIFGTPGVKVNDNQTSHGHVDAKKGGTLPKGETAKSGEQSSAGTHDDDDDNTNNKRSEAKKGAKTTAQKLNEDEVFEELQPMLEDVLATHSKLEVSADQQQVFQNRCERGPFAAVVKGRFLAMLKIRSEHVKDLPSLALALSTVKAHKRMLRFLTRIPEKYWNLNLDRAMEQYFLEEKRKRRWLPTTLVVKMATAHGALRLLPLYAEAELPVWMKDSVIWMQAMKGAAKMAKQYPPTQPTAASWEEVRKAIDLEPDLAIKMALLVIWLTCGRGGDALLLKPGNVELVSKMHKGVMQEGMEVNFWKGKTVKTRGSYMVFTQSPPESLKEAFVNYQQKMKEEDYLFKGVKGAQIKDALRRVNPKLEQRSLRRGAIQTLSQTGLFKDEELLHYSGHTNVAMLRRYLNFGKLSGEGAKLSAQAAALVQ